MSPTFDSFKTTLAKARETEIGNTTLSIVLVCTFGAEKRVHVIQEHHKTEGMLGASFLSSDKTRVNPESHLHKNILVTNSEGMFGLAKTHPSETKRSEPTDRPHMCMRHAPVHEYLQKVGTSCFAQA